MKVLVTGANGHVGHNLVERLLGRGAYDVRASVRSRDDETKVARLRALGDVEVVELDVTDAAGFAAALKDVRVLFHVAATYATYTGSREAELAMVLDAVAGVEVALRAAGAAAVERVVLTSSVVTVPLRREGDAPATEAEWNDDLRVPYFRAKTEAERAAWRLAESLGVRLVTVLPGGVGGPGFARRTPTIDLLESIMVGSMRFGAPPGNFTYVDARDVADAHILAAEKDVFGRFLVSNDESPTFVDLSRVMREIDPAVPAAPWVLPGLVHHVLPAIDAVNAKLMGTRRFVTPEGAAVMKGRVYRPSNERARRELGWAPQRSLHESLGETMEAMRALRRREGRRLGT